MAIAIAMAIVRPTAIVAHNQYFGFSKEVNKVEFVLVWKCVKEP